MKEIGLLGIRFTAKAKRCAKHNQPKGAIQPPDGFDCSCRKRPQPKGAIPPPGMSRGPVNYQ